MSSDSFIAQRLARRAFLRQATTGIGSVALGSLLDPNLLAQSRTRPEPKPGGGGGAINPLHLPPKARRVIFLCMAGGPSQFETFDNKPLLAKMHGQPLPESYSKGQPIAQLQNQKLTCYGPQFPFKRWGQSGQEISALFPNLGAIADDLCIIRSMQTEQINHDPAHTFFNTGTSISGRPSMGSWITYGLGSESENLPGFVVLTSHAGRNPQPIASRQWHSGFLPGRFQGVEFRSQGEPVHYLNNPPGVTSESQRRLVNTINSLNRSFDRAIADPEIETRIQAYEMAFRMQASVPELMDFSNEPRSVLDLYGTKGADGSFAANCLLARRLAERGVRFIHLYQRGWDHHDRLHQHMETCSRAADRASAALILDLKERGMLDDTLVIWGGEFGRTPMSQTDKGPPGRDHHIRAFSIWMAGGGIRGGITHGETDDLGYHAVGKPMHVHDLHATMLHLLGIDHMRLTVRYQGRDFRLTDVHGKVVKRLLV